HHLHRARTRRCHLAVPAAAAAGGRAVVPERSEKAGAGHMSAVTQMAVLGGEAALRAQQSQARLRRRHVGNAIATYTGIGLFVIFAMFPIYWMFITALKQNSDLYSISNNPLWFNIPATWENVSYLFEKTQFVRWCINTLQIAALVVAITLAVSIP